MLFLLGCTYEFGLTGKVGTVGADDTAAPVEDTAAPVEDTEAPKESDPPKESSINESHEDSQPAEEPQDSPPVEEPPEDDCDHTSDLIYVISRDDGALYLFDPPTMSFTRLARLSCQNSGTPGSMSVSRDGHAFVRYDDDSVYDVDLTTFSCTKTAYSDRQSGFGSFGMGYATDTSNTWKDQLYIANGSKLAVLDTSTWSVSNLGSMPSQSELTGNADGELWAILPLEHPAKLVELDKSNAHTLNTISLPNFPNASNIDTFAFATWGGDFYLFIRESGMGNHTDVYKVTGSGVFTKEVTDIGFDIVGAGVSTCAD